MLSNDILESWIQLTTRINNERIVSGFTFNEIMVARVLVKNQDKRITATDLCSYTKIQKSQMNRILCAMEDRGWISRVRSDKDKRQIWIQMKEDQIEFYEKEHARILHIIDRVIEKMGQEEAERALDIFQTILKIVEEENL